MRGARVLAWGAVLLIACSTDLPPLHAVTSLRLTLWEPAQLGSPEMPLLARPESLRFDLQALDDRGQPAAVDGSVDMFLVGSGARIALRNPCADPGGAPGDPPWLLGRVPLKQGQAQDASFRLLADAIFGQVSLVAEDPASRAQGATSPLYLPSPTIPQLMRPWDLKAPNASNCSPYLGRQVVINRASAGGKLIVSSVFKDGVAVSDTGSGEYRSLYVFTFGPPSPALVRGRLLRRLSGAIAKFNAFTQLANPNITPSTEAVRPELVPAPEALTADTRPLTADQQAALLRWSASPVRATATICDLTDARRADNWNKYSTFVLTYDAKDGCDNRQTFSVQLPARGFAGVDPQAMAGRKLTVTGMLQNSASPGGTVFWTVLVRDAADVCFDNCQ